MKNKINAYKVAAQEAAKEENAGEYSAAAHRWRTAYFLATNSAESDWCHARAQGCYLRATRAGHIPRKSTFEIDFRNFMEAAE